MVDGAGLMEAARHKGWTLHFADLDIDTSTLAGEMAANIIISGSQYERRLISRRTRDALAAMHARGARLGAAPALPLEVTCRIIDERANELAFQAIVDGLMADGIPTARGKATSELMDVSWPCGRISATKLLGECADAGDVAPDDQRRFWHHCGDECAFGAGSQ